MVCTSTSCGVSFQSPRRDALYCSRSCRTPPVLRELDQCARRRLRAVAWKPRKKRPDAVRGTDQPGRQTGPCGANRRKPVWSLEAQQQLRSGDSPPKCRLRRARLVIPPTPQADQSTELPCTDPSGVGGGGAAQLRSPFAKGATSVARNASMHFFVESSDTLTSNDIDRGMSATAQCAASWVTRRGCGGT
jgi:hypothetical protein